MWNQAEGRRRRGRAAAAALAATGLAAACGGGSSFDAQVIVPHVAAAADELAEPAVFQSQGGQLNLLMVAQAAPVRAFDDGRVQGWTYVVCPRPADGSEQCPAGSPDPFLGARLQLQPGDTLKVHLVNRLPPVPEADHAHEEGYGFLALNPTNLHLHGMLVAPTVGDAASGQAWGDNVFVNVFNPANGQADAAAADNMHLHGAVQYDAVDYVYPIPADHPSGLFWFHPHVHGISGAQVTAGMSGLVTVGDVSDYLCADAQCAQHVNALPVRHMMLRDAQVEADGHLSINQDPNFCSSDEPGEAGQPHAGACAGSDETDEGGADHTGGQWHFTINGQQYPTVTVTAPQGQVWRIANTSASVTYELNLWDTAHKRQMLMQVLAIDGVSIDPGAGTDPAKLVDVAGNKFQPVPCPESANGPSPGVCTTHLHLMPSSRAEVWVTYRDANGQPAVPPADAQAVLRTDGYLTGPEADDWPEVDLAKVRFALGTMPAIPLHTAKRPAQALADPRALAASFDAHNRSVAADPACAPLAPGHKRRIFFNAPADNPDAFGLGYEEVDENDNPVPGTFVDVAPFDPQTPTICLPLAAGNQPAIERWELVNLATEDHNFHIHQVHFRVLAAPEVNSTALPGTIQDRAVMMDNLPLPHADGNCVTVDDWRQGRCTAHVATVEIPFTIAGDFVYHCHILEHEDGGMMAVIRVRPDPGSASAVVDAAAGWRRWFGVAHPAAVSHAAVLAAPPAGAICRGRTARQLRLRGAAAS